MVLSLTDLIADEFAPEAKKLLGPFSSVVPLSQTNQLVLMDNVDNLRKIVKLDPGSNSERGRGDTFTHKCVYVRASVAEAALRNVLGSNTIIDKIDPTGGGGNPGFGGSSRVSIDLTLRPQIPKRH